MYMRSMWKGALSFGLVNIPVQMYTASHEKELSFKLLHKKDNSEIRYARICKAEDKEVPWNEIVKGYEFEKGDFVVLNDEDFEKANPKRSKTIEILHFIEEKEVDPVYYVKPYYLEPDKNADKAYSLLREALKKSKKVGLAKFILRNHEHIGIVRVHDNILVLNELRYQNDLLSAHDIKVPAATKPNGREMEMAIQLIDHLTTSFVPQEYSDTFTDEMKKIIKQKSKGRAVHPKTEAPKSTKVHDIMSLLKESLETQKKEPAKKKRKIA